ncbi:hybrid sensor histidine kinase/response regulator [Megalodesulfovibrio paquesii]
MRLNQKIILLVFLFVLLVAGTTAVVLFKAAERQELQNIRQRLHDIVSIAARQVDPAVLEQLTDPSWEHSPQFHAFQRRLQEIKAASSDIRYIYTLRTSPAGQIQFAVDGETNPKDFVHVGTLYEDASPLLKAEFATLNATLVEHHLYTDEWGTWLSGYAPVYHADGRRAGVLGVDIPAAAVERYLQDLYGLFVRLFLLLLCPLVAMGWLLGRRISRPILQMAQAAARMGQGDLDQRVNVSSRDEIGLLASELNAMAARLKQSRESLREMMERYRGIFDNAVEGIYQTTPQGRFLSANHAMAEMLGYATPEALINGITDIGTQLYADPDDRRRVLDTLSREGRVAGLSVRFLRKDGGEFWVELHAKRMHDHRLGEVVEGMVQDITGRLERERAEQERQAAEAASRAKSEFLANMSHEIRTPLNAIMGLTDLVIRSDLSPTQREHLKKIKVASQSLLAVINDILDFSKIEAGRLELERTEFSLYEVMTTLSEMFALRAHEKDIEFAVSIESDVPVALIGDPVRLGQVLINLAGNALKFTDKGEVVVTVALEAEGPGSAVGGPPAQDGVLLRFSVHDSGIGIEPERLEHIFDSFTQADSSTTRKYGGTGLGLAICKQLAALMGGALTVRSTPGKGSVFSFTARLARQPAERQLTPRTPRDLRGLRVLVVDDNRTSLGILADILTSFQMHADTAVSGEKALEMIREAAEPYDLILLDWKMPRLNGLETARRIKQDLKLDRTPIVCMVTAYGREDLLSQSESAVLDAFLHKPVNQSLLFDTIMSLFGRTAHLLTAPAPEAPGAQEQGRAELAGARVLLVEDNAINQEVAIEWLCTAGIVVTAAENGRMALELLQARGRDAFDAVLMDVQMPEMDGFEATRRIRALEAFHTLPVIAMTAHALKGDRERCLGAGMDDYLTKPIDPGALFATLGKWISLRKGREEALVPASQTPQPVPPVFPSTGATGLEALPAELPGIVLDTGLYRANRNTALYLRLLRSFARDYADAAARLRRELEAGQSDEARRLVHSIKGVAGNIGALTLSDAAAVVELELHDGAAVPDTPPWLAFEAALAEVLGGLGALGGPDGGLPQQDTAPAATGAPLEHLDHNTLVQQLEALARQLDDDLDAGVAAFQTLRPVLAGAGRGGGLLEQLDSCLDNFDIDGAIDCINALAAGLRKDMLT